MAEERDPCRDLIVFAQEPSHIARLQRLGPEIDAAMRRIIIVASYAGHPRRVRVGDRFLPVRSIDDPRLLRLREARARSGGLSLRLSQSQVGVWARIARGALSSLATTPRRQIRTAFRRAAEWRRKIHREANTIAAIARRDRPVLLFQVSAFDASGIIAARLGGRVVAFVENWQMPTKMRSAILAQLPGPPLGKKAIARIAAMKPSWDVADSTLPLNLTSYFVLFLAEGDGTLPHRPFLLNNGLHGRVLYSQPALAREYAGFGIDPELLERVAPPGSEARAAACASAAEVKAVKSAEAQEPIVLNPPSDYFCVGISAWGLPSYDALAQRWIEIVCASIERPFVLSLHPGVSDAVRQSYVASGLPISVEPIARLVARTPLYITYISTTTRLAAAHGVPMVVSDCYGFVGSDWPHIPNAIRSDDEASFRAALLQAQGMACISPPDDRAQRSLRTIGDALLSPARPSA